jgi:hypothetical protein
MRVTPDERWLLQTLRGLCVIHSCPEGVAADLARLFQSDTESPNGRWLTKNGYRDKPNPEGFHRPL